MDSRCESYMVVVVRYWVLLSSWLCMESSRASFWFRMHRCTSAFKVCPLYCDFDVELILTCQSQTNVVVCYRVSWVSLFVIAGLSMYDELDSIFIVFIDDCCLKCCSPQLGNSVQPQLAKQTSGPSGINLQLSICN